MVREWCNSKDDSNTASWLAIAMAVSVNKQLNYGSAVIVRENCGVVCDKVIDVCIVLMVEKRLFSRWFATNGLDAYPVLHFLLTILAMMRGDLPNGHRTPVRIKRSNKFMRHYYEYTLRLFNDGRSADANLTCSTHCQGNYFKSVLSFSFLGRMIMWKTFFWVQRR